MELKSPPFISQLPFTPPDSIPIHEFLFNDSYGRHPRETSLNPFTCGITGKTYSTSQVEERVNLLARALSKALSLEVNGGDEMEKVIGIFSLNTVDNMTVSWAIHRLSGVSFPLSASNSTTELVHLLSQVRCKALFTCAPLVHRALECAAAVGIPDSHVYVLDVPLHDSNKLDMPPYLKSVDELIHEGRNMAPLGELQWSAGQGARQTAYLCSSSGTSGLPKFVKVSHKNVIANIMQFTAYESNNSRKEPEMGLGVLPQSHGYSLILIAHASVYRGDGVVVLQDFDMHATLQAIQEFRIARLWLIPQMIVAMARASLLLHSYDLSSINTVFVGGSPLTMETAVQFSELIPNCTFIQAYGLTEAAILVCLTNREDVVFGSCGHLLPGFEGRVIDKDGRDVTEYDTPGELVVRSPSVMIGYYNNEAATQEILSKDGWLRTGDLVEIRKSAKGYDHIFIVDRIKELIKVRGYQVAPAELETYLMLHPAVSDVAVVPVPSGSSGEVPMAFVVKSQACGGKDEEDLKGQIHAYIKASFAKHKHLDGGIEFIDAIPKTAIGKTRRSLVKEMAKRSAQLKVQVLTNSWKKLRVPVQIIEFDSDDESD